MGVQIAEIVIQRQRENKPSEQSLLPTVLPVAKFKIGAVPGTRGISPLKVSVAPFLQAGTAVCGKPSSLGVRHGKL